MSYPFNLVVIIPAVDQDEANAIAVNMTGKQQASTTFEKVTLSADGKPPVQFYGADMRITQDAADQMPGLAQQHPTWYHSVEMSFRELEASINLKRMS